MSYIEHKKMDLYLNVVENSFEKAENDVYAHYCSLDSFIVFLKDYYEGKRIKRRRVTVNGRIENEIDIPYINFFASNLTFLNDSKEFNLGRDHVLKVLNDVEADALNKEIYVGCFCSDDDYLTQWKYYGKKSGLAVVFDTDNVFLNYYENENADGKDDMRFIPRRVIYDDYDDKINKIKEQYSNKASSLDIAQVTVPYIKDRFFQDEKESRIALYNIKSNDNKQLSRSKYRVSTNKIIPHIKMKLFYMSSSIKLPIKSVTIGPGDDQELVMDAVCDMLSPIDGYKVLLDGSRSINNLDIVIKKSKCPFKG